MQDKIVATLVQIARRRDPSLEAVTLEQPLASLGLDSLDLAQLVATLEVELGVDPFATRSIAGLRTVGDLCDAYRAAKA